MSKSEREKAAREKVAKAACAILARRHPGYRWRVR